MRHQLKEVPHRKGTLPAEGALSGFLPEVPATEPKSRSLRPSPFVLGTLAVMVALGAGTGLWLHASAVNSQPLTGLLQVESDQDADIAVDGRPYGKTPLSVDLVAGEHQLVLTMGGRTQHVAVTVAHNTAAVHHISWPLPDPSDARAQGGASLRIVAEAAGARITLDGVDRGTAPLTITDLQAGPHDVVVKAPERTWRRAVTLQQGETTSLVFSRPAEDSGSGWLSTKSAIPLQIFEDGKLIGSSDVDRIMVPSGQHSFELANEASGFRMTRAVKIPAGQNETLTIEVPQAALNVNATPWAQVWIDGKPLGETPIGSAMEPIGAHELIFRHPDLGERRVRAMISVKDGARISVDMRKP